MPLSGQFRRYSPPLHLYPKGDELFLGPITRHGLLDHVLDSYSTRQTPETGFADLPENVSHAVPRQRTLYDAQFTRSPGVRSPDRH